MNSLASSTLASPSAMSAFCKPVGRIVSVGATTVVALGLQDTAQIGDRALLLRRSNAPVHGEVILINEAGTHVLIEGPPDGIGIGDRVVLTGPVRIAPSHNWLGRIIDANGLPLDGQPLESGNSPRNLQSPPPSPTRRRPLGARMSTGYALFNTILPIVEGQRIGVFAGSGVGKSSLIGNLGAKLDCDVVVIALVGERGREVREFVENALGSDGLARSVVVAATSDQSALSRRRSAWTAMTIAEYFRDAGQSVLFLMDSVTRFAEAHREVATAAGEAPVLRGYPPSVSHAIMSLCERAGPGEGAQGNITGIFSVLVAGSDMNEPIADILRGVLDGHCVLERDIAERGRFPAVDVLKSVSRSLPACANARQNQMIKLCRKYLNLYDQNKIMIGAGLYTPGNDPDLDNAVLIWETLDNYFTRVTQEKIEDSFSRLELIFKKIKIHISANIQN